MKTISEIAKEIGVSNQTIYRKLNNVKHTDNTVITKKVNGITYVTSEGETLLNKCFTDVKQSKTVLNSDEINFLRNQNKQLQEELNKEREHSRTQSDNLAELANQLAKLSENNQILLDQQQRLQAASTQQLPEKKSKWFGWFKKKD